MKPDIHLLPIFHILTLHGLWKNFLCFLKKSIGDLGQFPVPSARKSKEQIKKQLNKSIINDERHENKELQDKAEKVKKSEKVAEIIHKIEYIIRSKNGNIGKVFERLITVSSIAYLQLALPHRISVITSLTFDCLFSV